MAKLFANSQDPDQMPRSAASDLGLHCLPITLYGSPDYNGFTKLNTKCKGDTLGSFSGSFTRAIFFGTSCLLSCTS